MDVACAALPPTDPARPFASSRSIMLLKLVDMLTGAPLKCLADKVGSELKPRGLLTCALG